jgi:hypothetical protein
VPLLCLSRSLILCAVALGRSQWLTAPALGPLPLVLSLSRRLSLCFSRSIWLARRRLHPPSPARPRCRQHLRLRTLSLSSPALVLALPHSHPPSLSPAIGHPLPRALPPSPSLCPASHSASPRAPHLPSSRILSRTPSLPPPLSRPPPPSPALAHPLPRALARSPYLAPCLPLPLPRAPSPARPCPLPLPLLPLGALSHEHSLSSLPLALPLPLPPLVHLLPRALPVTDLQGPPSERTQMEKLRDLKTLAQQYTRDRGSCDNTRIMSRF